MGFFDFSPKKTFEQYFEEGSGFMYSMRYEDAIVSLNNAIALRPDDQMTWYILGNAQRSLGRYPEALKSFTKAIKLDPDDPMAWYRVGDAQAVLGQLDEALVSFDIVIELNPEHHEAWYSRGCLLSDLNRDGDALASLEKAIAIKPEYEMAWYIRGLVLSKLGKLTESVASLDKALAFNPGNDGAWFHRGLALAGLGKPSEAVTSIDTAISLAPHQVNYPEARQAILSVPPPPPEETMSEEQLFRVACVFENDGNYPEGLRLFDQLLSRNPSNPVAWLHKGNILSVLGKFDDAVDAFNRGLDAGSADTTLRCLLYDYKGLALCTLQREDEGIAAFDQVIAISPDNVFAWGCKGKALLQLKRYDEAASALDRAIALSPEEEDYRKTRVEILEAQRQLSALGNVQQPDQPFPAKAGPLRFCTHCGQKQTKPDARFCSICGKKIAP
jgi:tetratricopeptide (TPR) repeat protein